MASYPWSTKIQAYLAKIAGKEVDNLPEPTTKEQALLKEIAENGGSSGGSTEPVIADTQTVTGTAVGEYTVEYSLIPAADYTDPSEYINKMLRAEVTRDGVVSVFSGQVLAEEYDGVTYIGASIAPDCFAEAIGYIDLSDGAITFTSYSSTADDITIKLEVLPPASLLVWIDPDTHALSATWKEIYNALIMQGILVLIDGRSVSYIYREHQGNGCYVQTLYASGGSVNPITYVASTPDDYPVNMGN